MMSKEENVSSGSDDHRQEILRMNDASFICFLLRECGRMVGAFPELEEEVRFLEI